MVYAAVEDEAVVVGGRFAPGSLEVFVVLSNGSQAMKCQRISVSH